MRFSLLSRQISFFLSPLLVGTVLVFSVKVFSFPSVVIEEISSVGSLADALHHGVRVKIQPIADPNLLSFKVEVSKDRGMHWYVYSEKIRPYDTRNILLPYRGSRYAFATGQDYQVRICAIYGTESQCTVSSVFQLPPVAITGAAGATDVDDDILTVEREYNLGTDPRNPDSDNDQMADHLEVARNIDPNLQQLPQAVMSPDFLGFSSGLPSGELFEQHQIFTIANQGERVLRISNGILAGVGASQFRYNNTMFEIPEIMPHQTRAIAVDFLPTSVGIHEASLDVLGDDIARFPVSLSMRGVPQGVANLDVTVEFPLRFSTTRVGETSESQFITVQNLDSNAPLDVEVFIQKGLNFLVVPNRFIVPSGGQRVEVTFSPEWNGTYEALLEVRAGKSAKQRVVQIPILAEATGFAPKMKITTTAINFGRIRINERVRRHLVIFNEGKGALYIKQMDFGRSDTHGTFPFQISSDTLIVPPGGSNRVEVTFRPRNPGNFTTPLCIVSNDSSVVGINHSCDVTRSVGPGVSLPRAAKMLTLSGVAE